MKERQPRKETTKVPDYILDFLENQGVDTVFGITGGGIANQLDAFSRSDIKFVSMQHEQAVAMAAEAYARLHKSELGVAMATSGPGGTNLITGINGCYDDSIPSLFITGQVGTFDLKGETGVRQRGFQESEMGELMRPIVKYTDIIKSPEELRFILEKAVYMAKEGRPGPVHIDLPIDIQMAQSVESIGYTPPKEVPTTIPKEVHQAMLEAKRPVIIAGSGIRLAGAEKEFRKLIEKLDWPVCPSWAFSDCLPESSPNKIGLIGVYGNRGANFAVQNSDLILAVGTRLDSRMTGKKEGFARGAKTIMVDIDPAELKNFNPDIPVNMDAKAFIEQLSDKIDLMRAPPNWMARCAEWKTKYPNVTTEHVRNPKISPYVFGRTLSDETGEAVIIPDCGGNLGWMMQSWQIKEGQRLFSTFGNSPMGYALPAAIGATFATEKPVVCIIGDGGIQMNIQELQTIKNYNVPIKIFILQNQGYGIIRQFQDSYMGGRHVGSEEGIPDFVKVSEAYGIPAFRIDQKSDLRAGIQKAMQMDQVVVEVVCDPEAQILPKAEFGNPLDEQSPPLSDKELLENLIVPRWTR